MSLSQKLKQKIKTSHWFYGFVHHSEGVEVIKQEGNQLMMFKPQPLKRLVAITRLQSASPILDMQWAIIFFAFLLWKQLFLLLWNTSNKKIVNFFLTPPPPQKKKLIKIKNWWSVQRGQ